MYRIVRFLENTIKKIFILAILRGKNETKCKLLRVFTGKGLHRNSTVIAEIPLSVSLDSEKSDVGYETERIRICHDHKRHVIPGYSTARL